MSLIIVLSFTFLSSTLPRYLAPQGRTKVVDHRRPYSVGSLLPLFLVILSLFVPISFSHVFSHFSLPVFTALTVLLLLFLINPAFLTLTPFLYESCSERLSIDRSHYLPLVGA